jgi:phage terminase Nu1 subunit (DNA packaging protein)
MNVSVVQLASEFGCTERQVQLLVKEGMPKAGHGKYDLERCKTWYIHYLKAKIATRATPDEAGEKLSFEVEQARLTKFKADFAEIELAEKRTELLPVATFESEMARMITQARQQLLQLPGRLAHQLEGEDRITIKSKLTAGIHRALASLSNGESDEHGATDASGGGKPEGSDNEGSGAMGSAANPESQ